jgi:hypothetical protein
VYFSRVVVAAKQEHAIANMPRVLLPAAPGLFADFTQELVALADVHVA